MSLRVITPVKPFAAAKQRLAPALDPIQRAQLAERMFRHVLRAASTAFGSANVLVISSSHDILAIAEAEGASPICEIEPPGLNSALSQAAQFAQKRGASHVLALASDLPLLQEGDLAELARHGCAIAPDRHGHGTNALLWPASLSFAFGENSFVRHLTIANQGGWSAQTVNRPGLAHDVDTPSDLISAGAGIPRW